MSEGRWPSLCSDPGHPKTGAVGRHEKGADALLAFSGVGHGEDDRYLGVFAGGDELLSAAQHPTVTVAPRPCLDRRGVGAGLRLGQPETREHLALRHRLEKPPLLLVRAVLPDRHAADRVLHAEYRRDRALAGGDLLHDQGIADMVGARPAIFLGHQHAHKAELAEFGYRLSRKPLLAVPFRGVRGKPFARKVAGGIAQHPLLVGKLHSMISSARARVRGGMASPSSFAVLRLTTNSRVVGCSTGGSAGFAPLRILSTKKAARL